MTARTLLVVAAPWRARGDCKHTDALVFGGRLQSRILQQSMTMNKSKGTEDARDGAFGGAYSRCCDPSWRAHAHRCGGQGRKVVIEEDFPVLNFGVLGLHAPRARACLMQVDECRGYDASTQGPVTSDVRTSRSFAMVFR